MKLTLNPVQAVRDLSRAHKEKKLLGGDVEKLRSLLEITAVRRIRMTTRQASISLAVQAAISSVVAAVIVQIFRDEETKLPLQKTSLEINQAGRREELEKLRKKGHVSLSTVNLLTAPSFSPDVKEQEERSIDAVNDVREKSKILTKMHPWNERLIGEIEPESFRQLQAWRDILQKGGQDVTYANTLLFSMPRMDAPHLFHFLMERFLENDRQKKTSCLKNFIQAKMNFQIIVGIENIELLYLMHIVEFFIFQSYRKNPEGYTQMLSIYGLPFMIVG